MSKISKAELTVISAEKVMGWRVDGMYLFRPCSLPGLTETRSYLWLQWNPLEDLNQAFQMLNKATDDYQIDKRNRSDKSETHRVLITPGGSVKGCCYHKDLATAIVLACVETVTGAKYELED